MSFKLEWLLAETAVEELKPMLSPNGKLTALKSTNRLEAMDAVINLQQIWGVLSAEQSKDGQDRLVREFELKFARAIEVQQQLSQLLGLDAKKPASGPMTPEQQMQMQQQAMMMAQQQQRQGGQPAQQQPKKQDDIHLIVNSRRNSILANAPSDRMAVIEQAIQKLDFPSGSESSLLTNIGRIPVYRLAALDPEPFVKTLEDSGSLDPTTKLEVDKKNRAIIATASMADHLTIRQLITKLDASGRRFEVIQLRRLEADYVAGTIDMMMGGEKKKQQTNRSYDYYFGYYGSSRTRESEAPQDTFRVDADVEFNRLLLWTNDIELVEVENLLVKLGEIAPRGGRTDRTRVLDVIAPEDVAELIERLRRAWPNLAPNEIQLPTVPKSPEPSGRRPASDEKTQKPNSESDSSESPENRSPEKSGQPNDNAPKGTPKKTTTALLDLIIPVGKELERSSIENVLALSENEVKTARSSGESCENRRGKARFEKIRQGIEAGLTEDAPRRQVLPNERQAPAKEIPGSGAGPGASGRSAPVRVSIAPDGRIVISSDDTQALDILEEMIGQLTPPFVPT